jgi:chitinase
MGPPHNVIYWDGDSTNLNQLAYNSYYTDVIVWFVYPVDRTCSLSTSVSYLPTDLVNSIQTLHSVGKTVLISFGGAGVSSSDYQACSDNVQGLAGQLANIVNQYGFDGVDIDFEDPGAFGGGLYDGVNFLIALTNDLYTDLSNLSPWKNIITHAPQTPYWTNNYNYQYPPYALVYWCTNNNITWFNNQTYNNCGPNGQYGVDCTEQQKVNDYQMIASLGVPTIKFVTGLPVGWCSTQDNKGNCTGDGFLPNQPTPGGNDVPTLIAQLQQKYPNQWGGIMGWDFRQDLATQNYYYSGYTWSSQVWLALKSNQPVWTPKNSQTGLCLDTYSSTAGSVYPFGCNGGNSQNWQFSSNYILDYQTQWCLDSKNGTVYTLPCNSQYNSQNWQFFGSTIRNRQTGQCLDSSYSSVYTDQCGSPPAASQNWQ